MSPKPPRVPAAQARQASLDHALLLTFADFIWELSPDGVLREVVSGGRKVLQHRPKDLIGQPLAAVWGGEKGSPSARRIARLMAEGKPFSRLRLLVRRKDGEQAAIEIAGAPIHNREGEVTGYRGMARDVTKAWRTEKDLAYRDRLSAALSKAILELAAAESVEPAIPRALSIMGRAMDADRLTVIEVGGPQGTPAEMLFAWERPGLNLPIGRTQFRMPLSPTPDSVAWWSALASGEIAEIGEATATGGAKSILETARAKSILFVPIIVNRRWWGHIGVDACRNQRAWSRAERDAVKMLAEMVGDSILRQRSQSEGADALHSLSVQAYHDPLTGLANRKLFMERLERAMVEAKSDEPGFAVHYVDLDHFKDVNETLGHPVGDMLLQAVADRLRQVTRASDLVARFGGDEFAILQFEAHRPEDAISLARKIVDDLRSPFAAGGRELHITGSVGVAAFDPAAVSDAEAMLAHAELALYRAKADGRRTFRVFTEDMDAEARQRVMLADDLRKGMAAGQFFLVYQPQVDMRLNRITGVEALVRWRHPVRGVVPPEEFIHAAEANGMIVQIGEWILRTACRQARSWLDLGLALPSISVNFSAVQFLRPAELQALIAEVVGESRLPAGLLQIELTETALMEASLAQSDLLDTLHRQGLKISLDDFGTGYSSLSYLHRYHVDQIKIAQEFVSGIVDQAGDAAIVKAAIGLARALDLGILAEGVETAGQARLLAEWGCSEVQGYYYSPPVPQERFARMLKAGSIAPAASTAHLRTA